MPLRFSDDARRTIMAIQHREHAVVGLQFHPESILTSHGFQILANFLKLAGITHSDVIPSMREERQMESSVAVGRDLPRRPVTF